MKEMKIIDSHAHLMDEMYEEDREEVIQRCIDNDMEYVVNIGFDKESCYQAVKLAEKYDWMYATVGMHPDECGQEELDLTFLKELARHPKVVAIGEIGLEYHYLTHGEQKDCSGAQCAPLQGSESEQGKNTMIRQRIIANQQKHFIRQIQLANELSLPVAIHSRDADMDMLKILKQNKIEKGFVMHCFSSSTEIAKEILKLGGYISLAGTVTFKNARNLREVAEMVPLEKLLVETDAPYLTPEPNRGKRNEPWHVWDTAKKIAEIKNISLETLVESVNRNIKEFYGI